MRRLLPLLALPALLSFAPPAHAYCDPEGDVCYPTDCMPWQPHAPSVQQIKGDPTNLRWLLPTPCP